MRNKIVKLNYEKLNVLYETFVPQQEPSAEQTYFSIHSTSNDCSEKEEVTSDLPSPKMPKESKLLKMFDKMGLAINELQTRIDVTLLEGIKRRWMSDSQNSLREFYKTDVILMFESLSTTLKDLQQELIEETSGTLLYVTPLPKKISVKAQKVSNTKVNADRLKPVTSLSIPKSVESSNTVRRPKSKDNKSKDRVLKNTNDKRPSAHVWKMSSSVSIDSNKREIMHLNNRSIVHTRYNKTPYELIHGRKPNVQYFHVFGSLCYPTNDHDDLGKMKPKADIAMASECNNLEPRFNCSNFQDSSEDSQSVPSKTDLDNLFGPLYKEYYVTTPQIGSPSIEQVKPNIPVLNENADEVVQEDVAEFDGNIFYYAPQTPVFEEAESSLTIMNPSNRTRVSPTHHLQKK
ncbi:hypothetical protein Tco_1295355 [Tanacetum coccineum]